MARANRDDDDDDFVPSNVPMSPYPWECAAIARRVNGILAAVEVLSVDAQVRLTFQKMLYRADQFGTDGPGDITLLIRTITESEGNGVAALVEPIVSAVWSCMRPEWTNKGLAWIETFDRLPLKSILQTMRGLDLFSESSIGHYYGIAIRNKLAAILEPLVMKPAPVRAKQESKPPRSVTRIPEVQTNIQLGVELLALRATTKSNCAFGRLVRAKGFDTKHASDISAMMQVARIYANRPEIFTKLSLGALVRLSSPTMPAPVRQDLEARILAGEKIVASDVIRACGTPKSGPARRPADQPAPRMAA